MPLLTIAILLISICSSHFVEAIKCEGCNSYECWENIAHCGPKGYLIAYGEKYCRKFGEKGMVIGNIFVMDNFMLFP
jgi:hypothetical protein